MGEYPKGGLKITEGSDPSPNCGDRRGWGINMASFRVTYTYLMNGPYL